MKVLFKAYSQNFEEAISLICIIKSSMITIKKKTVAKTLYVFDKGSSVMNLVIKGNKEKIAYIKYKK
jgi:hypothetical protein